MARSLVLDENAQMKFAELAFLWQIILIVNTVENAV
jgi:hypothetical protein